MNAGKARLFRCCAAVGFGLAVGCSNRQVVLPDTYLPTAASSPDQQSAAALDVPAATPAPPPANPPMKGKFEVPPGMPGAQTPPITPPRFPPNATPAERQRAVREAYPQLTPLATTVPSEGATLSLARAQEIALANSPVIRQATADADAAYGQVVQAGLHPNPTVGYEVDSWQPGLKVPSGSTGNGSGQQGFYINQLIKTAGKLSLAQKVAGYDYINAQVAVRKARVSVVSAIRTQYFAVLVAQQGLEVNKALATMADEVYGISLKVVAVGEAAGYEPLQLYAQAIQARNAVVVAEASYKAAWKQLAAAAGQPDMQPMPLAGRADVPAPIFNADGLKAQMLEQHTDLLTARNLIAQAQTNAVLQHRVPFPDLQTNTYQEYDNLVQQYTFGVQIGVALPFFDRNQGNIRSAQSKIASANQQLVATENSLIGSLAEALGRYEANTAVAASYRDKVIPSLTQAYRPLIGRWNADELGKVQFNDIVTAQQNLSQALQSYLAALSAQWQAVVDVANLSQLDDLYGPPTK